MKKFSFKQIILNQKIKAKKLIPLTSLLLTSTLLFPTSVFAAGGNAITESTIFKGLNKMLTDFGVGLLIIAPIASAALIGVFSLIQGMSTEQHDKEKWAKNKKNVLICLGWVMGATTVVTVVASYFK